MTINQQSLPEGSLNTHNCVNPVTHYRSFYQPYLPVSLRSSSLWVTFTDLPWLVDHSS